jgi:NAD(P)-dependent dehydrogenase (short-subunit alcohol dehydrogenase family)
MYFKLKERRPPDIWISFFLLPLLDVTKYDQVENAVKILVEKLGRLDVAIANAGIAGPVKDLIDYSTAFAFPAE